MLVTFLFLCFIPVRDEMKGLDIIDQVVRFGPFVDLVSQLKSREMEDKNSLGPLFELDTTQSSQALKYCS